MPLPETIDTTYLPGDRIDATGLNAIQHAITANHARIDAVAAPQLQWIAGKILGASAVAADGIVTVSGTARVLIDCQMRPIQEIRVHCRADPIGVELRALDDPAILASANHAGDGTTWDWVALPLDGITPEPATRLSLQIDVTQPQAFDLVDIRYQ